MKNRVSLKLRKAGTVSIIAICAVVLLAAAGSAQDYCPPTPTPTLSTAVHLSCFEMWPDSVLWETEMEINTVGFTLMCDGEQINETLIPAQALGDMSGALYTVSVSDKRECWLEELETGGRITRYGPAEVMFPIPISPLPTPVQPNVTTVVQVRTQPQYGGVLVGVGAMLLVSAVLFFVVRARKQ